MSSDSALVDLPLPDDALAALMASPGFQAQMAALTQQAMASLEGLVAALRAAEAQMAANPPELLVPPTLPVPEPIIDIPYGLAVEPVLLPWIDTPAPPPDGVEHGVLGAGWGSKGVLYGAAVMGTPVFRAALAPSPEEIARDMLAVLPQPAAAIEVVAATLSGAAGSSESLSSFVFLTDERAGGEGGTG